MIRIVLVTTLLINIDQVGDKTLESCENKLKHLSVKIKQNTSTQAFKRSRHESIALTVTAQNSEVWNMVLEGRLYRAGAMISSPVVHIPSTYHSALQLCAGTYT